MKVKLLSCNKIKWMIHQVITPEKRAVLAESIIAHAQLCPTENAVQKVVCVLCTAKCEHMAYFSLCLYIYK